MSGMGDVVGCRKEKEQVSMALSAAHACSSGWLGHGHPCMVGVCTAVIPTASMRWHRPGGWGPIAIV